jgi:hypothetical protein
LRPRRITTVPKFPASLFFLTFTAFCTFNSFTKILIMKAFYLCILLYLPLAGLRAQRVGIGTTSPQSLLEVATDGSITNGLRISNYGGATTVGPGLYFGAANKAYTIYATNTGSSAGANKFIIRDYSLAANRLTIDTTGNIGIATDDPTTLLDVNGTIRIRGGSPADGKILTSNGLGVATWEVVQVPASAASFRMSKPGSQNFISGNNTIVTFSTEIYNDGGGFTSNVFFAPATGMYHFDIKLMWDLTAVASPYNIIAGLLTSNTATEISRSQYFIQPGTTGNMTSDLSVDVKLNGGQYVYATGYQNSGTNQSLLAGYTYFSGHRVY